MLFFICNSAIQPLDFFLSQIEHWLYFIFLANLFKSAVGTVLWGYLAAALAIHCATHKINALDCWMLMGPTLIEFHFFSFAEWVSNIPDWDLASYWCLTFPWCNNFFFRKLFPWCNISVGETCSHTRTHSGQSVVGYCESLKIGGDSYPFGETRLLSRNPVLIGERIQSVG